MKRSPEALLRNAAVVAFLASFTAGAALQLDLRSGHLSGMPDATQTPTRSAIDIGGTLFGSFDLGRDLTLTIENRLQSATGLGAATYIPQETPDAVTAASKNLPAAEENIPTDNNASIALAWRGFELGYHNQLLAKNRSLDISYPDRYFGATDSTFTYSFAYKRKARHQYRGQYHFENDRFVTTAALYHFVTSGAIDSLIDFSTYVNSAPVSTSWTRTHLTAGILMPETHMRLLLGTRILSDYTGPAEFDSYNHFLCVEGDLSVGANSLSYRLNNEYYTQKYLDDPASPAHALTGMYQTLYLRNTHTLSYGLMFKGLAVLTYNEFLLKQRYDFSVRRAWFGGSEAEAGFFATMGGLFPMTGFYLRGLWRPLEKLSLAARIKSTYDLPREDPWEFDEHAKTLFVKADFGGEVAYTLHPSTELYLYSARTHFNSRTAWDFPTRFFTGAGLRIVLP